MRANFYTVNNYVVPPSGGRISAEYLLTSSDDGLAYNINPPSGAPVTDSWQTLVVDARQMNCEIIIGIGQGSPFTLNILPGQYESFTIPAYTQPVFNASSETSGAWEANPGNLYLKFWNFPVEPQDYSPAPQLFIPQSFLIASGSENTALPGGPFRFVDFTILNNAAAQETVNLDFVFGNGLHIAYPVNVPAGGSLTYAVWKSDTVPVNIVSANTGANLPAGVSVAINTGV
jgi:hypothetical protein